MLGVHRDPYVLYRSRNKSAVESSAGSWMVDGWPLRLVRYPRHGTGQHHWSVQTIGEDLLAGVFRLELFIETREICEPLNAWLFINRLTHAKFSTRRAALQTLEAAMLTNPPPEPIAYRRLLARPHERDGQVWWPGRRGPRSH